MNKKAIIFSSLGALVILSCSGYFLYVQNKNNTSNQALACPLDTMTCPDGSEIPRSGPNCEFGVCKQELPSYMSPAEPKDTITASNTSPITDPAFSGTSTTSSKPKNTTVSTNIFTKITTTASSLFKQVTNSVNSNVSSGLKETSTSNQAQTPPPQNTQTTPTQNLALNETTYNVVNNSIVDQNGNIIYTIPASLSSSGNTNPGWTTHIVDVIAVNQVIPVISSIPIDGLPGKYYLSENSFGNMENCEFSNKIFILDTVKNTKVLMYEENSSTLGREDPRACSSEMFLLATEAEKLIIKYHTVGTNTVCDSSWSEPEKTWFLDVTQLEKRTKYHFIAPSLYMEAQKQEATCRLQYEATTTEQTPEISG